MRRNRLRSLFFNAPQRTHLSAAHSVIILSAHSTRETNTAGLPNLAFQSCKSASETPRAREHAPQENTWMCLATTFCCISLSGGQPTGKI